MIGKRQRFAYSHYKFGTFPPKVEKEKVFEFMTPPPPPTSCCSPIFIKKILCNLNLFSLSPSNNNNNKSVFWVVFVFKQKTKQKTTTKQKTKTTTTKLTLVTEVVSSGFNVLTAAFLVVFVGL